MDGGQNAIVARRIDIKAHCKKEEDVPLFFCRRFSYFFFSPFCFMHSLTLATIDREFMSMVLARTRGHVT